MKGERKKWIKYYLQIYSNRIFTHLYIHCSKCVYLHIYTSTDMRSFGAKLCKLHYFFNFGSTDVSAPTHTNYISQRQQHLTFSSLFSSPCTTLSLGFLLSLSNSLLAALSFLVWLPLFSISSICGTLFLLSLYSTHKTTYIPYLNNPSHKPLVTHKY